MKLTGHLTASVYRRYSIADHEVLEEGVGKLAKLHSTPEKNPKDGCSRSGISPK